MSDAHILPDLLIAGLKVVFCGTAAGTRSAQVGAYYAGRGNKFWLTLYAIGLTPRLLTPHEFSTLPQYGIGLTDIAKSYFGVDKGLRSDHFDVDGLRLKIERAAPHVLAFNGKRSASAFYGASVRYGQQASKIGTTTVFVLPSTSGAANAFWQIDDWHDLAAFIQTRTP